MLERLLSRFSKLVFSARRFWLVSISLLLVFLALIEGIFVFNRQQILKQQSDLIDIDYNLSSIFSGLAVEHYALGQSVYLGVESAEQERLQNQIKRVDTLIEQIDISSRKFDVHPNIDATIVQYQTAWAKIKQELSKDPGQRSQEDEKLRLEQALQEMVALFINMSNASLGDISQHIEVLSNALKYLNHVLIGIYFTFALIAIVVGIGFLQFRYERQQAEKALQASENRLRALLEAIPDAVLRRNRAGYYTDFKPAKGFGRFMPSTNFLGKHISEILTPEVSRVSIEASERALATGEEQIYEYQMVQRQTQLLRDYEARVLPSGDDEVQVIIRDITEEKLRAGQIQQAQKLESLGVMAGGVAHDFNNLLTSIMAQISLARSKLDLGIPAFDQLDKASVAVQSAADLVSQLLAYTGKAQFQVRAIDLNQVLQQTCGLIEAALPNRTRLQLNLGQPLPRIEADFGQIQQVVMNLIINAAEALNEKGGYVEIITNGQLLTEESDTHNYFGNKLLPGQYVMLQVRDNGSGIEPTILTRIFEPFFSTKKQGHGLGLAASLGIIRSHHGAIYVESEVGIGTTMTLLFPAKDVPTEEAPVRIEVSSPQLAEYPQMKVTKYILVIDDDLAIRESISDIFMLEEIPFLIAASGEEGLELFRQQHEQICLVLLDMKMAGMGGKETFHALRQIEPQVRVILSSGFSETEISSEFQNDNLFAFLQKPYSSLRLMQYVRSAVNSSEEKVVVL